MNVFFIPQLGSMIYTMNGMVTRLELRADEVGDYQGLSAHFSGDGFPDMLFDVHVVVADRFRQLGLQHRAQRQCAECRCLQEAVCSSNPCRRTSRPVGSTNPCCSTTSRPRNCRPGPGRAGSAPTRRPAMLGKLSWSAIPFDQPIPLVTGAIVLVVIFAVLLWVVVKGHLPYLWSEWITSVDHKRIGVMYTLLACVMLLRGFADAIMMRAQQALAFQSHGFLPPEHYNQIFSAHGTIMIFFVAMPFVIGLMNFVVPLQLGVRDVAFPDPQLGRLLAHRDRRAAGQRLARGRRVRAHRLAALSAAVGADLFARRRRRLLPVVAGDLRRRHAGRRHQSRHHGAEDPHPRHDLSAHADVLLDHARRQPADRRRVPDPDRDARRCCSSTAISASISSPTRPAAM